MSYTQTTDIHLAKSLSLTVNQKAYCILCFLADQVESLVGLRKLWCVDHLPVCLSVVVCNACIVAKTAKR